MKKVTYWSAALITGKHASAASVVGGVSAVMLIRFDDPIVWACAAGGVATTHYLMEVITRRRAIGNAIGGMFVGGVGTPWLYTLAVAKVPESQGAAYLLAFVCAALFPKIIEYSWEVLIKSKGSIQTIFIELLKSWGGKK